AMPATVAVGGAPGVAVASGADVVGAEDVAVGEGPMGALVGVASWPQPARVRINAKNSARSAVWRMVIAVAPFGLFTPARPVPPPLSGPQYLPRRLSQGCSFAVLRPLVTRRLRAWV